MRAPDGGSPCLTQSEVPYLALTDEIPHRAGDVFDRHVWVDAVLVQKIDRVDPEPPQRPLDRVTNALRSAVEPVATPAGTEVMAEFGGNHHAMAERLQSLTHKRLIGEGAVHLRGIEQGDASFYRRAHQRNHRATVRRGAAMIV
jgi:hypothetical protein